MRILQLQAGGNINSDCGPWSLQFPHCNTYGSSDCYEGGQGLMFDTHAFREIEVNGIA